MLRASESATPTKLALSLPEILEALGQFIHLSDLGSCILVSRLWNETFTPWLWRTVDDSTLNWSDILYDLTYNYPPHNNGKVVEKDDKWLRAVLIKHGRYIRHLSMSSNALLLNAGAAGSAITRLRSLSAQIISMGSRLEEEAPLYNLPVLAGMNKYGRPTVEQQQAVIDSHVISPVFADYLEPVPRLVLRKFIRGVVASQRFWLLVMQNPDLESLNLGYHSGLGSKVFKKEAMVKTMASLPKLKHLDNKIIKSPLREMLRQLTRLEHYSMYTYNYDQQDYSLKGLKLDQPFPRLRSLRIEGYGDLRTASLFNLLEFLPSLEQLRIQVLQSGSRHAADSKQSIEDQQHSRLRGLHIVKYDQEIRVALDETIAVVVLPALQFLTEITLRVLMPATVAALAEQCLHLETVRLLDDTATNKIEMTLPENMPLALLHGCPTLKHLYTARHSVDARLLLAKPIACRELETFCCQVVGVDRLTSEEQVLYDSSMTRHKEERTATTITTPTRTTEEEKSRVGEVLRKHQRSQILHHQIYDAFSELTHLTRLDFGYDLFADKRHRNPRLPLDRVLAQETNLVDGRVYHKEFPPNSNTLKLSLDSGLDRLRSLVRLKEFGFRGVDHRVGTEELDWMVDAWPRLERVLGVEDYLHLKYFGLDCEKSRMLMKHVQLTLQIKRE